jgi:hypothetical protein
MQNYMSSSSEVDLYPCVAKLSHLQVGNAVCARNIDRFYS